MLWEDSGSSEVGLRTLHPRSLVPEGRDEVGKSLNAETSLDLWTSIYTMDDQLEVLLFQYCL
jgi:hypothetical protein